MQTANTTTTTPATTHSTVKSAKQRKREAADAKLAGKQPERVTPIYAKPEAPAQEQPKTDVPEEPKESAPAPPTTGHNSNKGKQIAMNTVGPKRELAYAVVGLLSLLDSALNALADHDGSKAEALNGNPNLAEAKAILLKHGYDNLKPRAERIEALKAELQDAASKGDLQRVTELAKQMKAVQDGRAD